MTQIVSHKKVKPFQGILMILAILVLMFALNWVIGLIGAKVGSTAAAIFFWIIGILIVLWMFRRFVLLYQYTIDGEVLYISRRYGKRLRAMTDVYMRRIVFIGTPEEAGKKYPGLKKERALHSACSLPATAIIYKTADDTRMLLLQANDELKNELVTYMRNK